MVDVVIVGGGHNGLVAAAYLARAGRSVLRAGAAATSSAARPSPTRPFAGRRRAAVALLLPGQPAARGRSSTSSGSLRLARRRVSSYTPGPARGGDARPAGGRRRRGARPRASFARVTGGDARRSRPGTRFYARTAASRERVFPTLTEPLRRARASCARSSATTPRGRRSFERPLGETLDATFADDLVARRRADRRADRHVRRRRTTRRCGRTAASSTT